MQYKNIKHYSNLVLKNRWFNPIFWFFVVLGFFCSASVFAVDVAKDELTDVMTSAKLNFGAGSTVIKLMYLAEIIAGAYAWHKTKHPSAVIGIVVLALFTTFAMGHWVG